MELEYLKHIECVNNTELSNLIDQFGDDVVRYAYALTKDYELSKDIAQDVFIKVHAQLHTFRGQSSFKTWLLTITRNMALNANKSSYVRRVLLLGQVRSKQTSLSAEQVYIGSEAALELRAILLNLPRKLREVLVLELEHELSMDEMAAMLDIPQGTVKSRLSRARRKVEQKWREQCES